MRTIRMSLTTLMIGLTVSTGGAAERQDVTPPEDCSQLDEQLKAPGPGGLGDFLMHASRDTKNAVEKLDSTQACKRIAATSDYVGSLLGIASYCDAQSVIRGGAASSPIYKRLGSLLRSMSNEIHTIADQRGCWKSN